MACITMLNKIGLSTDPWCTPTLTSKLSLSSPFLLTAVVTPSYILLMTFTIHSSTPTCLKAHHKTSYMWHSVEGLLQVHKRHPQLLLFAKELFLNLSYNKDCICCSFTRAKSKLHLIYLYSLSKPCLDYSFQHL